jgi:hypothetical protein
MTKKVPELLGYVFISGTCRLALQNSTERIRVNYANRKSCRFVPGPTRWTASWAVVTSGDDNVYTDVDTTWMSSHRHTWNTSKLCLENTEGI